MKTAAIQEINKGWEAYYSTAGETALWKDETESFLVEHFSTMTKGNGHTKILDIGCGDGRNTFIWIKNKHNVTCVDVAKSGLEKIGKKAEEMNYTSPLLICEDFLKVGFLPSSFDVVQCFDALAQINDVRGSINKLCDSAKSGGYIIFNYFTQGDCAYGEGERIDEFTFTYKDTLFKFHSEEEIVKMLPQNVEIIKRETRRWDDPAHGDYRPHPHTHEAAFFLLRKK